MPDRDKAEKIIEAMMKLSRAFRNAGLENPELRVANSSQLSQLGMIFGSLSWSIETGQSHGNHEIAGLTIKVRGD